MLTNSFPSGFSASKKSKKKKKVGGAHFLGQGNPSHLQIPFILHIHLNQLSSEKKLTMDVNNERPKFDLNKPSDGKKINKYAYIYIYVYIYILILSLVVSTNLRK